MSSLYSPRFQAGRSYRSYSRGSKLGRDIFEACQTTLSYSNNMYLSTKAKAVVILSITLIVLCILAFDVWTRHSFRRLREQARVEVIHLDDLS